MNNFTPALPTPSLNPAFAAMARDPCAAAEMLQGAQLQLLAGANVASVMFEGQQVHFSRVDAAALQAALTRLETMCAARHGVKRTVRAGPHARWTGRHGYGFGGY